MRNFIAIIALAASLGPATFAQNKIHDGTKLFIARMEGNLDRAIAAEITRQNLPVTVVGDDSTADYVLAGTPPKASDKWASPPPKGKKSADRPIVLIDPTTNAIIWTDEEAPAVARANGGKPAQQSKAAEHIVKKMKGELF